MSSETIRKRLEQSEERTPNRKSTPLPVITSNVRNHPAAIRYLESVNSLFAVEQGLVKVRYLPADNRVAFYTKDGEGCVARSLSGQKPKWKVYGEVDGIMQIGTGGTAVVVEDVASACSVSRMFPKCSGCAILGTHVTTLARRQLRRFNEVVIALDKDASRKALRLKGMFESRVPTRVVLLEEDLKYATQKDLERLL
jgi:hypothetical protein